MPYFVLSAKILAGPFQMSSSRSEALAVSFSVELSSDVPSQKTKNDP